MDDMDSAENFDLASPLSKLLSCKVCYSPLKDPVIINACNHRVCTECVENHIQRYGRHCPECNDAFTMYFPDRVAQIMEKLSKPMQLRAEVATIRTPDEPSTSNGLEYRPSNGLHTLTSAPPLSMESYDENSKSNGFGSSNGWHDVNSYVDWEVEDDVINGGSLIDNPMDSDEYISVVLWPDSSVYQSPLPISAKRPRFIRVPADSEVAHLEEYIFIRLSTESDFEERSQYSIEFTYILKEGKDCRREELQNVNFLWSSKGRDGEFDKTNDMFSIPYPWTPLNNALSLSDVEKKYRLRRSKPLKLVFRFVQKV